MKQKQRKCQLCSHLFVPKAHNQKYCTTVCRDLATKLRSIKRDTKEHAISIEKRINEILNI